MSRWMLKAAVQHTTSLLPGSECWNYLLQKYLTRSLQLDEPQFRDKLQYAKRHLGNYFNFRAKERNTFDVLELGTGWYPVIPIAFYLCGASKIWTIDKQALLRVVNVRKTLQLFADAVRREDLSVTLPWLQKERIRALVDLSDDASFEAYPHMLAKLNINIVVRDARDTGLEQGSIDFFFSNSVLQEIPDHTLRAIFVEFRRLASPAAIMSHYVNMVEPYAEFDPAVTAFHFLQYSDAAWRLLNNSLHYHNRLRISDYRRIHESACFGIVQEDNERGLPDHLNKVRLAKKFVQYSREDLLILRSWMISALEN